jgi:sugar/nucleoside kinase (ribokinase family)
MNQILGMVDIVGVGLNATDTLIELPSYPPLGTKVEFSSTVVLPGGQVASAIMAVASWGLRTRYIGKLGDDAAAELHRREFARAGVEVHLIRVQKCASQSSYIFVDRKSGERTILWQRNAQLALQPQDLQREWIVNARLLHVDGHDGYAAAAAARWAREAGIPVTGDFDNLYHGAEELLTVTDYAIVSREFPSRMTGESDLLKSLPMMQRRFGCRVAGATLGQDGALVWDGQQFWYAPAYRVNTVDTTGAGDIFHAAFAFGLLKGWALDLLTDFSCAAAGLNCTALGARGGIRSIDEIERLMRAGKKYDRAVDDATLVSASTAARALRTSSSS